MSLLQSTGHNCLLGETAVYERRKADSECFNGEQYQRAINVTTCSCIHEDFEWSAWFLSDFKLIYVQVQLSL